MLPYRGSSFLLIRGFIQDGWARLLLFIFIATSGYQFIQPSSELIAESLLSMFFLAQRNSWPLPMAAFLLAGFGFCKVELSIGVIAITAFWAFRGYLNNYSRVWRLLPYTLSRSSSAHSLW